MMIEQYLIVPAVTDSAGQCRIVRRPHEIMHPDPLDCYRRYPEQWADAGFINSRGKLVALDAEPEVVQVFRDSEPLYSGLCFGFDKTN